MGRNCKVYDSLQDKLENERAYHREYYQKKKLPKKVDTAISLVCDTKENILKFIETVGREELHNIMYPKEE